jgi:hypothetical protein
MNKADMKNKKRFECVFESDGSWEFEEKPDVSEVDHKNVLGVIKGNFFFDDNGNGINVFNTKPTLVGVVLFDQVQYKQDTVGSVNDFEVKVNLGFDWTTFNAKQNALTLYDLSETFSGILTITGGLDSVLTNDVTIQVKKASAAQDGYLGKDDWATFNGKLTSPMTANGDLITQIGGVADNLAIGSDTQVLTVVSGLPSWQAPAVGSQLLQGNTKAYVKDTGTDGYFAVVTEGVERLRVTPDGYVGVGVTSPTERLHLQDALGVGALVLVRRSCMTHADSSRRLTQADGSRHPGYY